MRTQDMYGTIIYFTIYLVFHTEATVSIGLKHLFRLLSGNGLPAIIKTTILMFLFLTSVIWIPTVVQWGLKFRTFENRTHSNSERLKVRFLNGRKNWRLA